MKKTLGLLVFLGLFATPALAQKITIDYAHDFDFEKIKTFQFVEADDKSSDTNESCLFSDLSFHRLDSPAGLVHCHRSRLEQLTPPTR